MEIKSCVYTDANGIDYPVKVNRCRFSNTEGLFVNLDLLGIKPNDTLSIRIVNNCAEIGKGNPATDADDITYAVLDANGNVKLRGYGG
ncbi:MAG: hypothetical protein IJI36_00355 [Kiritimatiellae bacterium]|nr:hypothetical protein [Kiritimatiellia bacterium]